MYEQGAETHQDRKLHRRNPAQRDIGAVACGFGDELFLSDAPDGLRLTASAPDFARSMALAKEIMREDRDILHVLAK